MPKVSLVKRVEGGHQQVVLLATVQLGDVDL